MKLIESDAVSPRDEDPAVERPVPPPPVRRRVSVSLLFSLSVLVGTVVAIYLIFPARDNVLVTESVRAHRLGPTEDALREPTFGELAAWSLGSMKRTVPWPQVSGASIGWARSIEVLNHQALAAHYQLPEGEVTVVIERARDAVPRRYTRTEEELLIDSWQSGRWTVVAVGRAEGSDVWRHTLGVPRR